jgi:hypothetical protein
MKRLMMLLMLWTGLIHAVYTVEAAKQSRDAPAACTDGNNIVSADAANLIDYPNTGPTAPGPWTSYPYTACTKAILPDPVAGETFLYADESVPGGLRTGKRRL